MPRRNISILLALGLGVGLVLAGTAFAAGEYGTTGSPPGTTDMKAPRSDLPAGHPPVTVSGNIQRASEFIGKDVENPQGEEIGEVSELVLDPDTGRVSYAVVSVSGISEMADRMIAVPFQALNPKPGEEDKLVLNIDRTRLRTAPSFERNAWPEMTPEWRRSVDDFFAPGTSPPGVRGGQ